LIGQKPKTVLQSIPLDEMSNEVKRTMLQVKRLFEDEINCPLSFFNSRFGQSFTVLTYCRMLHTLYTKTVQSKKAGMLWAKQFLDPKWVNLIDQAWNERKGVRFGVKIGQRAKSIILLETLVLQRKVEDFTVFFDRIWVRDGLFHRHAAYILSAKLPSDV
jgi:hypothetical protein